MTREASPCGAYGLALRGIELDGWLVPAERWPEVEIVRELAIEALPEPGIEEQRASFNLMGGGRVALERDPPRMRYLTPHPLRDDEVVHPHLAIAAATMSYWLGREPFHAGAIVGRDGAWGVMGPSGAGKSSLLAGAAAAGAAVVSDDLLVCQGLRCFAGPRAVDLMNESAAALGVEESATVARGGSRRRVQLPQLPPELPLAGWVDLEWSERVEVTELPPPERLRRLARRRTFPQLLPAGETLLDLVALPGYVLRRPREWASFDAAVGRTVELTGAMGAPSAT